MTQPQAKFGYSENLLSNWTAAPDFRYEALMEAISSFSEMPEDSDYYIDLITKDNALKIVSKIQNNINANPPKLMTQDGESAILTWEGGPEKIFLIISGLEISLFKLNRETRQREDEVLSETGEISANSLAALLNSGFKSETK
ncbi:hypothetical protein [uncultured Pleomorphomonas sp.]|nr:hypothetical protein [uncultured Pleomorphomonas sp.]